jgi:5-methyltetrahydrofolate--homocysteine methyltransferase
MPIDFAPERWDQVRQTYERWWAGTLDRPVITATVRGRDPGRARPEVPLLTQASCMDLSFSPDEIIDRIDYELSQDIYLGDAYPLVNLASFGPGIMAAFCGAKMDNSTGRVWFSPAQAVPIKELHLEYDGNNVWLNRIKDLYRAGMRRWKGQVLMSMTDLGGTLDILASFIPTETLLMDVYDHPEDVARLVREIRALWLRYYRELNDVLQPVNPGYSDWSGIYCREPSYMLQSDFAYMIGPQSFRQFVLLDLAELGAVLPRTFYHLDGVGQLKHLDDLLGLDRLRGIQWVPGDGMPDQGHWPDVYRRIHAAGRLTQLWGDWDILAGIVAQTGSGSWIQFKSSAEGLDQLSAVRRQLAHYEMT